MCGVPGSPVPFAVGRCLPAPKVSVAASKPRRGFLRPRDLVSLLVFTFGPLAGVFSPGVTGPLLHVRVLRGGAAMA